MRFALASDLHFEFHRDDGETLASEVSSEDVLVVAGDLCSSHMIGRSLTLLLRSHRHVVYVLGNHEFYGSSIPDVRDNLRVFQAEIEESRSPELGTLHVLDNSTCEIEGQRFVGTTMWFPRAPGIEFKERWLHDFSMIRDGNPSIYEENRRALEFLADTVRSEDVVVTHHLPTEQSVSERWKGNPYNCFFLCDVEALVRDRQPRVWCHGHTHDSCDYRVGETRVICNPFGYAAREENPSFDSALTVEL